MIYDLCNPSDPVTFDAPSTEAALCATALVGEGHYSADPVEGDAIRIPIFMLGGFDEWMAANMNGANLGDLIEANRDSVIQTLRSFVTGSVADRKMFDLSMSHIQNHADRVEFARKWDDMKRSSMNAIARTAHDIAERMAQSKGSE